MNMQVTYANRSIHGIKVVLIIVTLLTGCTFVYVPVFLSTFINEVGDHKMPWILALPTIAGLILEFGLLYLGLKIIVGKLHIVADDSKVTLVEQIPGFKARVREIKVSCASCIRMDCEASNAAALSVHSHGHIPLDPVSYNIKISDTMASTPVLSSGNYELVASLYQKLCSAFPACRMVMDLSARDILLQQYQACVNKAKLRAARFFSFFFLFASLLTAFPLAVEYLNDRLSNVWTKTAATVAIPAKETGETGEDFSSDREVLLTYPWQGRLYSKNSSEGLISNTPGNTVPVRDGSTVEIYVNPQNPEQYTLGARHWSSMRGLMIALVIFLLLFMVLLRLSFRYKKIDRALNRDMG